MISTAAQQTINAILELDDESYDTAMGILKQSINYTIDDLINLYTDGILPGYIANNEIRASRILDVSDNFDFSIQEGKIVAATSVDIYSTYSIDRVVQTFVLGTNGLPFNYPEAYSAYSVKVKESFPNSQTFDANDYGGIRRHFYYSESNDFGWIPIFENVLTIFGKLAADRIEIHKLYGASAEAEEIKVVTELLKEVDLDNPDTGEIIEGWENLDLIGSLYFDDGTKGLGALTPGRRMIDLIVGDRIVNNDYSVFLRAFSSINPDIVDLNNVTVRYLMNELQSLGALDLVGYLGLISDFAKRRTKSTEDVKNSALNYVEDVDVAWLTKLSELEARLRQNPLVLFKLQFYFPSLFTLILDALAVIADYSNDGLGGSGADPVNNPETFRASLEKAFGVTQDGRAIFELAYGYNNTAVRIKSVIDRSYFRENISPKSPDIFHLRLGAANFYVPPITIDINTFFKAGSMMSGALRQKNSPKFNSGYKETVISMRLFFPNYEEIWGISVDEIPSLNLNEEFKIDFRNGGDSEDKIDKFLSSLRGLVAAFRYSPFLPVKNHYLNSVHGITAVGLSGMTISTIPNFPFALAVDLELVNFNHKPLLPMISDFNQAIHWGKYRQYMGKAAGQLNRYVNEEFLLKSSDLKETDTMANEITDEDPDVRDVIWNGFEYRPVGNASDQEIENRLGFINDVLRTNIIEQWKNGNHLTIFAPAESQTKLYLPSTSSFRSDEEKVLNDIGAETWESVLNSIGIQINADSMASFGLSLYETLDISRENSYSKSAKKIIRDTIDMIVAGQNSQTEAEQTYAQLVISFIQENSKLTAEQKEWLKDYDKDNSEAYQYPNEENWIFQTKYINGISLNAMKLGLKRISSDPQEFLKLLTDAEISDRTAKTGIAPDPKKVKDDITKAFNVALYERFFQSGPIQSLMEAARARAGAYQFNEWEVPMVRVDLDPELVIINGVTVTLGNVLVKLQVQMQDEPTYQHIGGKDSFVNISMTVMGESELIKIKKIFDHMSSLARLEHASGVIGFLGIKNIITALAGIKYVMPLTYSVKTRPNYPHVYDVELSLIDFDIFQQKREELSNRQEKDFIDHFGTKKNPFLRIKQLWGSFNAYPDFPLSIKNDSGEIVGHLDPDFYFRSFKMFDEDVVNNVTTQQRVLDDFVFDEYMNDPSYRKIIAEVNDFINQSIREYLNSKANNAGVDSENIASKLAQWLVDNPNVPKRLFLHLFNQIALTNSTGYAANDSVQLLTEFIELSSETSESNPYFMEEIASAPFIVGNVSTRSQEMALDLQAALEGEYNLRNPDGTFQEEISFNPDEVTFHKQIFLIPAADKEDIESNKLPAILQTAFGTYYGYMSKSDNRFYLTIGSENVKRGHSDDKYSWKFAQNPVKDVQTPDTGTTNSLTGVVGMTPLSQYQNPYTGSPATHWEKMLNDTSYRDVSGRMIRAFPTYMLWLIDEGGYFAGVKLFDNFYGLQSIIDFSVVSSEDLLGDTLIFRVSNLYSKLTRKESSQLFSSPEGSDYGDLTLTEGLGGIIDRSLNMARNILSGMRHEYVVDIASIRLKPGVRVHLRGGYGANPNSLQTLFNGVITNVEQGEIVTITAQSDAIELGAVVNSTNQKGDSGKIDGGIDTGMYLSEPRDLMVRLLSMGSSRSKEAILHATRGRVFSENKFGIRHFGSILYEPLSTDEARKNEEVANTVSAAFTMAGSGEPLGGFATGTRGIISSIGTLWANFTAQVDLEIFKRNIYPGNGLGIAQFLGGDLDDGWLTAASLVENQKYNDRVGGYLGRLTDIAYNNLITNSQMGDGGATRVLDGLTRDNALVTAGGGRHTAVKAVLGTAVAGAVSLINPVAGVATGLGLMGVLNGRGGTNLFRTMGIISPNDDDDLKGYDEVSFRAQTYMRTVWDLFQICARLLPNYIVAVRPFEDRSTIFYGKPHWLYTSGVVPLTTGYPTKEKALELGISSGPKEKEPDQVLAQILDEINRDTNPLSDYSAYFEAFEPSDSLAEIANNLAKSTGIYAPSQHFVGKTLNFFSEKASTFVDPRYKNVLSKLPVSKGKAYIGPHLPVIAPAKDSTVSPVIDLLENQRLKHAQITALPPRYRFPFYSITENAPLDRSSSIGFTPPNGKLSAPAFTYNSINEIVNFEVQFLKKNKFSLLAADVDGSLTGAINLDNPINFSAVEAEVSSTFAISDSYVMMPIPQAKYALNKSKDADSYDAFEYEIDNLDLNYAEWGTPETVEDEQFYIAMRWPYFPNGADSDNPLIDESTLEAFKDTYGITEMFGTAADYKQRKVLVYNPTNKRAVVCRPAFFMWGEASYDAIVSPDAAHFLSITTLTEPEAGKLLQDQAEENEQHNDWYDGFRPSNILEAGGDLLERTINVISPFPDVGTTDSEEARLKETLFTLPSAGYRQTPTPQECLFAFVPDSIPVGVLSTSITPINEFKLVNDEGELVQSDQDSSIVGFGKFVRSESTNSENSSESTDLYVTAVDWSIYDKNDVHLAYSSLSEYALYGTETIDSLTSLYYGGNPLNVSGEKSYFQAALDAEYDPLMEQSLNQIRDQESNFELHAKRVTFLEVYDPADLISVQARQYYDERFDPEVSVIAGNGRTIKEAQEIWDQFRAGYHNYESVKGIFASVYGLDPNVTEPFPEIFKTALFGDPSENKLIPNFGESGGSALDEFEVLFGSDYMSDNYVNNSPTNNPELDQRKFIDAIEFMRTALIDAPSTQNGLIAYYNDIVRGTFENMRDSFFSEDVFSNLEFSLSANPDKTIKEILRDTITTPKQLFLFIVGIFRQRLWEHPYARAWLVLKPDKRVDSLWEALTPASSPKYQKWSFKSVDKIFWAFIDPYQDYAKSSNSSKFLKLLISTKAEGNSTSSFWGDKVNDITGFFNRTIGPVFSAIGDALSGLLSMFKFSMQQLGYALSEINSFKKQANILNKVFNDSIYYSLGREGSVLRAADNPFTREYGEPVLEVREPFQRLHYISSFSHILSNQIQENLNGVATTITAVSDGKYPVTVALDKGAPAERQVEKTVETGIYYDNFVGSGLTAMLHPLFHPLETFRGIAKNVQGVPDELMARRIALAHLKESIKDIYGGELLIIGNGDIRPHDLVYLSDVYERMYGIFEVEQVIHHFTPELGFVTSITPNALVTVNDPARWFMTSWAQSWMHVQNVRNDTRIHLDSIRSASSGLMIGGQVSVDRLGEILTPQLVGGYQFTHGSSALVRDVMAMQTANDAPAKADAASREVGGVPTFAVVASFVTGGLAWKGWKWVRDKVLDQHGCYVQYLNKNGQPMDAGLSYNQGMVVGQHHSTALLPGILGTRTKTRSPEGFAYIRTDDLFKSLGWRESEISEVVRYISYESSLVHARVLGMSGLSPDRAEFDWKFRVVAYVNNVKDGDTIDVTDIFSGAEFTVRLDGINTAETNKIGAKVGFSENEAPNDVSILYLNTPAGMAYGYVRNALLGKFVVLRINQTRIPGSAGSERAVLQGDFEAGNVLNNINNYELDIFGRQADGTIDEADSSPRALASVFYHATLNNVSSATTYISNLFRENIDNLNNVIDLVKNDIYDGSPFRLKFDNIYENINKYSGQQYYSIVNESDPLFNISEEDKKLFSNLVYFKIIENIYDFSSRWPQISWDEYYEDDGHPATLNWELVTMNLAKVFVKDMQKESQSVQTSYELMANLREI